MATDKNVLKRDGIADASIAPYRFLKQGSGGRDAVAQATTHTVPIIGVSPGATHDRDTTNAADAADQLEVYYGGFAKVETGAAVNAGDFLTATTAGKAIKTASAGAYHGGIAMNSATASAEIIGVQIVLGQGDYSP